jgi:hypothetical protein
VKDALLYRLGLGAPTSARWHADAALASLPVQTRWFGVSERSAKRLVNGLSGLVDPEDPIGEMRVRVVLEDVLVDVDRLELELADLRHVELTAVLSALALVRDH